MRLFPKADGAVNRFERAALLTIPFDLSWLSSVDKLSLTCHIERAKTIVQHIERTMSGVQYIERSKTFVVER